MYIFHFLFTRFACFRYVKWIVGLLFFLTLQRKCVKNVNFCIGQYTFGMEFEASFVFCILTM